MGEVVNFKTGVVQTQDHQDYGMSVVGDYIIETPTTQFDLLCKFRSYLTTEDYRDVLCAIMDIEMYGELCHTKPKLAEIATVYFALEQ